MSVIIEYKNVSKIYGDNFALKDINLSINEGEFITVVGSSGSGKTTLMKIINGMVSDIDGEVLIFGENIKNKDIIEHRRGIGYVIQGNVLFPHMTVEENIAYVPNLLKYNSKDIEKVVDSMLELVDLSNDIKTKFPDQLSGGEQQRVGIARAFATNPNILLMDEPFGAIDAITRYQLQNELKKIHKKTNKTIVFITHDIREALKLGDKILVLNSGKIQQFGTPKEILENPTNKFVKQLVEMA